MGGGERVSLYIDFTGYITINKSITCQERNDIDIPSPFEIGYTGTSILFKDSINSHCYNDFVESLRKVVKSFSDIGYFLNGKMKWSGEYREDDKGIIYINNNKIEIYSKMPDYMNWGEIRMMKENYEDMNKKKKVKE
jgi:hypothetical protein